MAGSYAGAYGAGAASDELHRMLAERFEREKFAEHRRQAESDETFRRSEAAAAHERESRREVLAREEANERKRQFDTTQKQREDDQRERRIDRTVDAQKRSMEIADDHEAGVQDREDRQRHDTEQLKSRQAFEERLMRSRASGGGDDSGPLVAIKDPATGQPRLVPRSQAVNATPASTRDQALTEGQSNAAGFADRMKFNEDYIKKFDSQSTSRLNQLGNMLLPNEMRSDEQQGYETAKKNWIAAILRKESGAAISPSEYAEGNLQYFPQPGESAAVVEQKRQLRQVSQDAMRRSSGTAGLEGGGAGPSAPGTPGAGSAPRLTRTIRNRTTGETRQQTSLDGGATWN